MCFKGSSIRRLVVPLHGVNKQNLQVITLYGTKRFSLARDIFYSLEGCYNMSFHWWMMTTGVLGNMSQLKQCACLEVKG